MSKSRGEYFISCDVEMDGPCAGLNSMLQLGAAFYDYNGNLLEGCCWNLYDLPDAYPDPDTLKWWESQEVEFPGIRKRLMADRKNPETVMHEFKGKVEHYSKTLKAKATIVAYPSGFDFSAIYYYLRRFTGESCVGFSCIDLKTMSMALLNRGYRDHGKKDMPRHWFKDAPVHDHNALNDAIGQGAMYFEMRKDLAKLHERSRLVDVLEAKLTDAEHRAWEGDKDWS